MRTIAVVNQKGGCGKTTTAINLAASLAELGRRVLLVDIDPQGHASLGLSIRSDDVRRTMYHVLLGEWCEGGAALAEVAVTLSANLHLAPSNIMVSAIEQQLSGVDGREDRLKNALAEVADRYDYCVIDSPPNVGLLTFNALRAADEVLIPVETGFFSLHGVTKLLETVAVVNAEYGQDLTVRVLPTMYEARHRIAREVLAEIRRHFPDRVTQTVVRMNVRLREAASFGLPVVEFDPASIGAREYRALAAEIAGTEAGLAGSPPSAREIPEPAAVHAADVIPLSDAVATDAIAGDTAADFPLPAAEEDEPARPEAASEAPGDTYTSPAQWTVVHPEPAEPVTVEPLAASEPETADALNDGAAEPADDGEAATRVVLVLHAPGAGVVQVAGDFNNWTPQVLQPDGGEAGLWRGTIPLRSGRYRYRFIVDNVWGQDPRNPDVEDCPYGGYNSIVTVA